MLGAFLYGVSIILNEYHSLGLQRCFKLALEYLVSLKVYLKRNKWVYNKCEITKSRYNISKQDCQAEDLSTLAVSFSIVANIWQRV